MMFCLHCGSAIEAGDAFCENCGQRITYAETVIAEDSPLQQMVYTTDSLHLHQQVDRNVISHTQSNTKSKKASSRTGRDWIVFNETSMIIMFFIFLFPAIYSACFLISRISWIVSGGASIRYIFTYGLFTFATFPLFLFICVILLFTRSRTALLWVGILFLLMSIIPMLQHIIGYEINSFSLCICNLFFFFSLAMLSIRKYKMYDPAKGEK